jgi:hypothetical protein
LLLPLTGGKGASAKGINAMNDTTLDHDQADNELLTGEVSDEALEAAAGADRSCFSKGRTDWPAHNFWCC